MQRRRFFKKLLIALTALLTLIILIFATLYIIHRKRISIQVNVPYDGHLKEYSQTLSEEETFQQDLKFIYQEIKDYYVNLDYKEKLYHFDWDERYEYFAEELEKNSTKKDFYRISSELIATLKDGHVWYDEYQKDPGKRLWAPDYNGFISTFELRYIEGKPIIVATRVDQELIGYEVVSINSIPFTEIMDTMLRYKYPRGNDESAKSILLRSNQFYQYFILQPDEFPEKLKFELENKEGLHKIFTLPTSIKYNNNYVLRKENINLGYNKGDTLPTYYIKDNIGYINISTFGLGVEETITAFDDIVKDLKEAEVQGVVIDLRYNGGGNESFRSILGYLTPKEFKLLNYHYKESERYREVLGRMPFIEDISSMLSDFIKRSGYTKWKQWTITPAKEQFLTEIPVAVLSNECIFSSTGDFLYGCLEKDLATVIGNMVPLSGFGQSTSVLLPSGNYVLSYCFFESLDIKGKPMENVIMEPDIKVEQTNDDLLNNVDTQLEAAFDYIKERTVRE